MLSMKAQWLLAWAQAHPDEPLTAVHVATYTSDGVTAILSARRELLAAGVLVVENLRDDRGQWHKVTRLAETGESVSPTLGTPNTETLIVAGQSLAAESGEPDSPAVVLDLGVDLDLDGLGTAEVEVLGTGVRQRARETADQAFAAFWAEYPRKIAKPQGRLAYQRALRTATADEIMAGLRHWLVIWDDPTFIPYPATWLNRHSWNDQPTARGPVVRPEPESNYAQTQRLMAQMRAERETADRQEIEA